MEEHQNLNPRLVAVVASLIEAKKLTYDDVHVATGIPPATLSRRLNGRTPFVSTEIPPLAHLLLDPPHNKGSDLWALAEQPIPNGSAA